MQNLHSAHQGVTSMSSRALATVFWPGITSLIEKARNNCRTCHRNAPSQAKLPPTEPTLPKVPFEMICSDYFQLAGNHYLVVVDRLSGWPEVKIGNGPSGAKRLCHAHVRFSPRLECLKKSAVTVVRNLLLTKLRTSLNVGV